MTLPFTHQQFLEVFGEFNRDFIWLIVLLWVISFSVFVRLLITKATDSKIIAVNLAALWLFSGIVYHLLYFSKINSAATVFGGAFILQALIIVWRNLLKPSLVSCRPLPNWRVVGLIIFAYGLVYPFAGLVMDTYPNAPLFAVPCPTTIITLGCLLFLPRRESILLGFIPLLWAIVGGSAALLMNVPQDYGLIVAGITTITYWIVGKKI